MLLLKLKHVETCPNTFVVHKARGECQANIPQHQIDSTFDQSINHHLTSIFPAREHIKIGIPNVTLILNFKMLSYLKFKYVMKQFWIKHYMFTTILWRKLTILCTAHFKVGKSIRKSFLRGLWWHCRHYGPILVLPRWKIFPSMFLDQYFWHLKEGGGYRQNIHIYKMVHPRKTFTEFRGSRSFFCLKVLSIFHFEHFLEQLLQTIAVPSG